MKTNAIHNLKELSRENLEKIVKKIVKKKTNKKKNTFHNMCITRKNAMDNAIKEYNRVCRRLPSLPKNEGEYARLGSIQPKPRPAKYAMLTRGMSRSRYPATVRPVYKTIATPNKKPVPSDAIYESINRTQLRP